MMLSSRILPLRRVVVVASSRANNLNNHVLNSRNFAGVSMSLLKDLRARSGAPMVECKKALEQTDNKSLEDAMDWLRQHGAAKASSKLQGRDAEEGLVGVAISDNGNAAIVEMNSETDFAGRSQAFAGLVEHVAYATLQAEKSGEVSQDTLMSMKVNEKSVQNAMEEAIVSIRENLKIASAVNCKAEDGGQWVGYIHGRVTDMTGSSAALVHVKGAASEVLQEVGKKLAMHVVAARPLYLDPDSVPDEDLEKEKAIMRAQMADSGKPPDILEKIIAGKMRKFYEGVCLTEQSHMVVEGNPKVSTALKEAGVKLTHYEFRAIG